MWARRPQKGRRRGRGALAGPPGGPSAPPGPSPTHQQRLDRVAGDAGALRQRRASSPAPGCLLAHHGAACSRQPARARQRRGGWVPEERRKRVSSLPPLSPGPPTRSGTSPRSAEPCCWVRLKRDNAREQKGEAGGGRRPLFADARERIGRSSGLKSAALASLARLPCGAASGEPAVPCAVRKRRRLAAGAEGPAGGRGVPLGRRAGARPAGCLACARRNVQPPPTGSLLCVPASLERGNGGAVAGWVALAILPAAAAVQPPFCSGHTHQLH